MPKIQKLINDELNLDYPNGSYPIHSEHLDLRNLWRAVIMQALHDIRLKPKNRKSRSAKNQAIKWVDLTNQGFIDTCALAEFNPEQVAAIAHNAKPLQVSGVKFITH